MSTNIEDRLFSIRYKADDHSHLGIQDQDICLNCPTRACTFFCPADVYSWQEDMHMMQVAYENCVECGTCRIGCSEQNIKWAYPRGGFGITYKFG